MTESRKADIPVVVGIASSVFVGLLIPHFFLLVPVLLVARKIRISSEKRAEKEQRGGTMSNLPSTSFVPRSEWGLGSSPFYPTVFSEQKPESVLASQNPAFGLRALEIAADRAAEVAICQTAISNLASLGQEAIKYNPGLRGISSRTTRVKEVPGFFGMRVAERTTYDTVINLW